jgi:hypothetical protein
VSRLQLYFSSRPRLALDRTSLETAAQQPIISVRGKTAGVDFGRGTFQWSPAVKALAILGLRSVQHFLEGSQPYIMEGSQGSPASSLAYAISKKNDWIMDVFGVGPDGESLARRFITASNAHRKSGERVALAMNPHQLPASGLAVFLDGAELRNSRTIARLVDELELAWPGKSPRSLVVNGARPFRRIAGRKLSKLVLTAEVRRLIKEEIRELLAQYLDGPNLRAVGDSTSKNTR